MKPPFASLLYVFVAAMLLVAPPVALAADDDEDGDAEKADGDAASEQEEYVEPDAWERPPEEQEKAPKKKKAMKKEDLPPGDGRHLQIGLNLSWGFAVEKPDAFPTDAWNFGVGLRPGYTFEPGVYGGLVYTYFIGSDDTFAQLIAAEAGFDWWVAGVIVRPSVDLGAALLEGPDVAGTTTATVVRGGFYFGPAISVIVPLGLMYTGGEVRHAVITSGLQSTTMVSGYVGVRL